MDDDKVPRNLYPDPVLIPSIYASLPIPEQWSDRCVRRGLTCLQREMFCVNGGRPKNPRVSWRKLGMRDRAERASGEDLPAAVRCHPAETAPLHWPAQRGERSGLRAHNSTG